MKLLNHLVSLPLSIALGVLLAAAPALADRDHDRDHHRHDRRVVRVVPVYQRHAPRRPVVVVAARHHVPIHHRYARKLTVSPGHVIFTFVW